MAKRIKKIGIGQIDLLVYDFDGVMTNNKVFVFEDGREAVVCSRCDGLAIAMIRKIGVPQIILSTEENKVVGVRAQKLKIEAIHGVKDKKAALAAYCHKNNYALGRVVYVGNDVNDFEVMRSVGYPLAPCDAHNSIRRIAVKVMKSRGGEGVIRELLERILTH